MSSAFHRSIFAFAGASLLALAGPAGAQPLDIGEVVITPNRTPTERSKVGASVDTVDQKEIEQHSQPLVDDYLARVPGISVSTQGGIGKETSLSLRGADKKYIKTLFNGIDIADPTATQVQPSFEHLLTNGVTSIEVLKGSQSTLYGADAVAGVIGISTLPTHDLGVQQRMMIEAGSHETVRAGYGISDVTETGRFSFDVGGIYTGGISAAMVNGSAAVDSDPTRLERDAYRNLNASFVGEKQLSDTLTVFGAGLFIRNEGDFDNSGNPPTDNTFNTGDFTQAAGRVGFNLNLADGRFRNTVSLQHMDLRRSISQLSGFGPFLGNYHGRRTKLEYQGAFDATDRVTLQFGADYAWQHAQINDNYGNNTDTKDGIGGVWGQVAAEPLDNFTLTAGVRHDEHSKFGGFTTWRGTASYLFEQTGTRLHASVGTGFRAPSLYENNYVSFIPTVPVPNLKPEESFSWDAGVEQSFMDGRGTAGLTYFELNTENLIDYDFINDTYVQIPGTTRRKGVEASLDYDVASWLTLGGVYTYTSAVEADGDRRPRIPRHMIGLTATVTPAEKWEVSAAAKVALDTVDVVSSGFGSFSYVGLSDYTLVSAKVAYKPTEQTELYLRAENLLDQKYQTVSGYNSPGLSVYAGLKATFGP